VRCVKQRNAFTDQFLPGLDKWHSRRIYFVLADLS
jgi:hypothetical protein